MATTLEIPTAKALRPLLMLLLFFVLWSERSALQSIAGATAATLVQLADDCRAAPSG